MCIYEEEDDEEEDVGRLTMRRYVPKGPLKGRDQVAISRVMARHGEAEEEGAADDEVDDYPGLSHVSPDEARKPYNKARQDRIRSDQNSPFMQKAMSAIMATAKHVMKKHSVYSVCRGDAHSQTIHTQRPMASASLDLKNIYCLYTKEDEEYIARGKRDGRERGRDAQFLSTSSRFARSPSCNCAQGPSSSASGYSQPSGPYWATRSPNCSADRVRERPRSIDAASSSTVDGKK